MNTITQNTEECPSTPPPASGRVAKQDFGERVAAIFRNHRGSRPASIVDTASRSLGLIIGAIEADPDRITTETMISQMLEVTDLLDAVHDELKTVQDDEFALGARYAGVSERARLMGQALVNAGERHDHFTWAALLMRLDASVLSDAAMEALRGAAQRTAERVDAAGGAEQVASNVPGADHDGEEEAEENGKNEDDEDDDNARSTVAAIDLAIQQSDSLVGRALMRTAEDATLSVSTFAPDPETQRDILEISRLGGLLRNALLGARSLAGGPACSADVDQAAEE